jgi:hypothetical protein
VNQRVKVLIAKCEAQVSEGPGGVVQPGNCSYEKRLRDKH